MQQQIEINGAIYSHLIEIRRRVLFLLVIFSLFFLLFFYLAPDLFRVMIAPLLKVLPKASYIIATQVTAPLMIPIHLAADAALLASTPFALYHLWRFISPGLYLKERSALLWIIGLSLVLFILGVCFSYYIVLPYLLNFFVNSVPAGIRMMPDMVDVAGFITRMLLVFGCCFQVPLLCLMLVKCNLINVDGLRVIRPYVIVAAFTVGMIFTPPDVLSQIMLAVPLCMLYELGILLCITIGIEGDGF